MEQLKEYLEKLESADMTAAFCIDGEEEAEVRGVTFDSKEVVSGGIFVCKGKNFRVEYLKEALERGCICYVSEKRYELSEETAWIQVKDIRKAMPCLLYTSLPLRPPLRTTPTCPLPRETLIRTGVSPWAAMVTETGMTILFPATCQAVWGKRPRPAFLRISSGSRFLWESWFWLFCLQGFLKDGPADGKHGYLACARKKTQILDKKRSLRF